MLASSDACPLTRRVRRVDSSGGEGEEKGELASGKQGAEQQHVHTGGRRHIPHEFAGSKVCSSLCRRWDVPAPNSIFRSNEIFVLAVTDINKRPSCLSWFLDTLVCLRL